MAAAASSWLTPSSGTSQKAVMSVPAMLPAVEIAYRRPAVRPAVSTERTARRIAIGETDASTTLAGPKRMIAVTSGLARGPGSHSTTHSSTGSSMIGTSSTRSAPSVIAPSSSCVAGRRSASVPPSQ